MRKSPTHRNMYRYYQTSIYLGPCYHCLPSSGLGELVKELHNDLRSLYMRRALAHRDLGEVDFGRSPAMSHIIDFPMLQHALRVTTHPAHMLHISIKALLDSLARVVTSVSTSPPPEPCRDIRFLSPFARTAGVKDALVCSTVDL